MTMAKIMIDVEIMEEIDDEGFERKEYQPHADGKKSSVKED